MPLATSYLEPNDYSVLKFAPDRLNVNDIAKTLAVQTAYWNQGAERVKSRYMDALNLNVSNPQNQQLVQDYVSKSEDLMKNLSTQDLGNPDVQQEGIGIFKNLFNDKGIMYDDALTKHYNQVRQDYYGLLKTDPSKASTTNLGYALEDQQKFINDPDRNSSINYYNNRKDYIPYYDATGEINNVMKSCKADTIGGESPTVGTGYSDAMTDKSLTQDKVQQCFEAGLSQQARQQFNINGYMAFKNNPDALANEYMGMNNTSINRINKQLSNSATVEATLLNKKQANTATPDELSTLSNIQASKKNLQSQLDNYTDINTHLANKDYSDMNKNFENIAGSVFTNLKTSGFGKAFSFNDFTNKFVTDPVQMLHYKQVFDGQQNQLDRENQMAMKEMEISAKMMSEKLGSAGKVGETITGMTGGPIFTNGVLTGFEPRKPIYGVQDDLAPTPSDNTPAIVINPYKQFQSDVQTNTDEINKQNTTLAKLLNNDSTFMSTVGNTVVPGTNRKYGEFINDVAKGQPTDFNIKGPVLDYLQKNISKEPLYGEWLTTNLALQTKKNIMDENTKAIEATIPNELKDGSKDQRLNTLSPITVIVDGRQHIISPHDMQAALEGKANSVGLKVDKQTLPFTIGSTGTIDTTPQTIQTFSLNGRQLDPSSVGGIMGLFLPKSSDRKADNTLTNLLSSVQNIDNDRIQKLTALRNQKYGQEGWEGMNYYKLNEADKSGNLETLKTQLATLPLGTVNKERLKPIVQAINYQGGVEVYLPGFDGSTQDIINAVGGIAQTKSGQPPTVTKLVGTDNYRIQGISTFDYSKDLGLDSNTFELGMELKAIGRNLKDGESRQVPIPILRGGEMKQYSLKTVQGANGPSYRLLEPDTDRIIYSESDVFQLMNKLQTLQNRSK